MKEMITKERWFDICCKEHLIYDHTAATRGYVSRKKKSTVLVEKYSGRFGEGYKLYYPRYDSTKYCDVCYYIKAECYEGRMDK